MSSRSFTYKCYIDFHRSRDRDKSFLYFSNFFHFHFDIECGKEKFPSNSSSNIETQRVKFLLEEFFAFRFPEHLTRSGRRGVSAGSRHRRRFEAVRPRPAAEIATFSPREIRLPFPPPCFFSPRYLRRNVVARS